jgi:hypothetical protein
VGLSPEQHNGEPQRGEHVDERDQHAPRSDYHYVDVAADYYAQHDYFLDGPDDDSSNDDAHYCAFECPGLWACGSCVL